MSLMISPTLQSRDLSILYLQRSITLSIGSSFLNINTLPDSKSNITEAGLATIDERCDGS